MWITAYECCFPNAPVKESNRREECVFGPLARPSKAEMAKGLGGPLELHHCQSQHKHLLSTSQRPILLPMQNYVGPRDAFKFVYNWYLRLLYYPCDTKMKLWGPSILIKPQGRMIWGNHCCAKGSILPPAPLKLLHPPQMEIEFDKFTNTSFIFSEWDHFKRSSKEATRANPSAVGGDRCAGLENC